ncbi:MAG TPA: YbhB/YbcL family Raf kinase inhibitor-like protein [Candidatus Kapabacteria bacterium]|nr:YbhB/YbcL family Raf kinase inhibitor-like protein [Candidatus Kapabacteria bacterium]
MMMTSLAMVALVLAATGCRQSDDARPEHIRQARTSTQTAQTMDTLFALTSTAFGEGAPIPRQYTCDDRNIAPPLRWSASPGNAKSLALILDDPDAPHGIWVHWVLFNIPPTVNALEEGISAGQANAMSIMNGKNSFGNTGYGGPCPPSGTHHYYFRLYALDTMLPLKEGATRADLDAAMKGHMVARTTLMGTYQRK